MFESSAHPLYSPDRESSALQLLDQIIHVLSLYSLDRHDPFASRFYPRSAAIADLPDGYRRPARCSCLAYTVTPGSPTVSDHLAYFSSYEAPWDPNWDESEIRKEECRRLCWCALTLASAYTAHCSAFHMEPAALTLAEPSNVSQRELDRRIFSSHVASVYAPVPGGSDGMHARARAGFGPVAEGVGVGAVLPEYASVEQLQRGAARRESEHGPARELCD